MSREGPDPVEPVVSGNVRYEAVHWGKAVGLEQNGGYIRAFDAGSGEELWTLKIYDIDYSRDMEPDRLDVFITGLTLSDGGRTLLIDDEDGRRFAVDLGTRAVQAV